MWIVLTTIFLLALHSGNSKRSSTKHEHHHTTNHTTEPWNLSEEQMQSVMAIDKGIEYGVIFPFSDEWNITFASKYNGKLELSPMQFWFRCVDREVRGYFFVEDLAPQLHGKEASMHGVYKGIQITADDTPVDFRMWNGGGDFFFNISHNVSDNHVIDVKVEGFKHYTRFPVSKCQKSAPVNAERKHIMHIHLRDFSEKRKFNPHVIDGLASHMAYHRCALKLDKYEVVVQAEYVPYFLRNEKMAHAVKEGWLKLWVRNPVIPPPLSQPRNPSNCYYQAYAQNMAILQHWKENVKMFMFDSDEYINTAPDMTSSELMQIINSHTAVGFDRLMIFCTDCNTELPEVDTMSLTKSTLSLNNHRLAHPKLVIDPNRVGCYIVHWAGCGDKTKHAPIDRASIIHFENLYSRRWSMHNRKRVGNETVFQPGPVQKLCDPTNYDWKSPLPSFHST